MVENGLRESLSTSGLTESGVETEGLGDGKVCLHGVHGGTDTLLGREDVSTSNVETRLSEGSGIARSAGGIHITASLQPSTHVNTTLGGLGHLDLDQEHRLLETWGRQKLGGETDTTHGRHDLTSTSVNGIGVELGRWHNVSL